MASFSLSTLALVLLLVALPLVILWRLSLTPEQHIWRLHLRGWSQQRIASRLGVTRWRVRRSLGVA